MNKNKKVKYQYLHCRWIRQGRSGKQKCWFHVFWLWGWSFHLQSSCSLNAIHDRLRHYFPVQQIPNNQNQDPRPFHIFIFIPTDENSNNNRKRMKRKQNRLELMLTRLTDSIRPYSGYSSFLFFFKIIFFFFFIYIYIIYGGLTWAVRSQPHFIPYHLGNSVDKRGRQADSFSHHHCWSVQKRFPYISNWFSVLYETLHASHSLYMTFESSCQWGLFVFFFSKVYQ